MKTVETVNGRSSRKQIGLIVGGVIAALAMLATIAVFLGPLNSYTLKAARRYLDAENMFAAVLVLAPLLFLEFEGFRALRYFVFGRKNRRIHKSILNGIRLAVIISFIVVGVDFVLLFLAFPSPGFIHIIFFERIWWWVLGLVIISIAECVCEIIFRRRNNHSDVGDMHEEST